MRAACVVVCLVAFFSVTYCEPAAGGWKDVDPEDPSFQKVVSFALADCDQMHPNSLFKHKLLRIVAAQSQIVAGVNYRFQIVTDLDGKTESHSFVIWDRFGDMKVTEHDLLQTVPDGSVGGFRDLDDLNDVTLVEVANYCMEELNRMSNSIYKFRLIRIIDAQVQVVAGLNYRVRLEAQLDDPSNTLPEIHHFMVWKKVDNMSLTWHHTDKEIP